MFGQDKHSQAVQGYGALAWQPLGAKLATQWMWARKSMREALVSWQLPRPVIFQLSFLSIQINSPVAVGPLYPECSQGVTSPEGAYTLLVCRTEGQWCEAGGSFDLALVMFVYLGFLLLLTVDF